MIGCVLCNNKSSNESASYVDCAPNRNFSQNYGPLLLKITVGIDEDSELEFEAVRRFHDIFEKPSALEGGSAAFLPKARIC